MHYLGLAYFTPDRFAALPPDDVKAIVSQCPALDEAMRATINGAIRTALSPRFLPNEIFQVAEIPRTLSGKKQELPIKKLLLGQPLEKVVNKEAMANPGSLEWYVGLARQRAA